MFQTIVKFYNDVMDSADPRSTNMAMMSSPLPTLTLVLIYLLFVKIILPEYMKNRKAFEIKNILIAYNFIHTVASTTLFYYGTKLWINYNVICEPVNRFTDAATMTEVTISWWFFMSRFMEFADTVFFVLRKKNNQVTTLHILHHSLVPLITWAGMKFAPIGHYTFAGYLNVFVHIFMYSYYMFAAMGPAVQKYLWWKKYLTVLQLVQFALVFLHSVQTVMFDCNVPKSFAWVVIFQAMLFFGLFRNYYNIEYAKSQKLKDKNQNKNEENANKKIS